MRNITARPLSKLQRFCLVSPAEHHKLAIDAAFTVKKPAGLLGQSQRQLEREFERHFHHCPKQWLHQKKRMELAMACLMQEKSVDETASELRFRSRTHFSRAFKQYYGRAPSTVGGNSSFRRVV